MSQKFSRTIQNKLYEKCLSEFSDKITATDYSNIDIHDVGIVSECIYFILDRFNSGALDRFVSSYEKAASKSHNKITIVPLPHHRGTSTP